MFWKKKEEQKETKKEEKYLGEVYMYRRHSPYWTDVAVHDKERLWVTTYGPEYSPSKTCEYKPEFVKFKEKDTGIRHDGYTEIFEIFHKKENIFYYNDIYSPLRDKIIKRNSK